MATELGKAYVQIMPSAKGISGAISGAVNPEAQSAGTGAGKLLGSGLVTMLTSAIAAAGIGKLIKSSLMEGADLEQNLGGTEAVFGQFAQNVQSQAQTAYK
uniref:hypothetical protein n=1 Tax=Microbacterium sp. 18062 TaxID=2681410 RepID=UPI00190F5215